MGKHHAHVTELVTPTQTFNAIPYDEPDNRIIVCAVEAKSYYIITGDLDLLRLKDFRGIKI